MQVSEESAFPVVIFEILPRGPFLCRGLGFRAWAECDQKVSLRHALHVAWTPYGSKNLGV